MVDDARFEPPPYLITVIGRVAEVARSGSNRGADVVGGTVRDVLLSRPVHDLDLAVAGDAAAFARALADALAGHYVRLDGERDIARVVIDVGEVRTVDVAARQGTLEDDLRRRDFTIDALAVPLGGSEVIDVTGGLGDLRARVVRAIAPERFDEDPLRLLRAARIASELGFAIEPATCEAIRLRASRLREAAPERQRDELARLVALDAAYDGLRLLDDLGLLSVLFPELDGGRGLSQPGPFHAYDVFEHNVRTVEALDAMLAGAGWLGETLWQAFAWCERDLRAYLAEEMSEGRPRAALLRIGGLLHDVAKPQTCAELPDGRVRFVGHDDIGARIAGEIMRRLRFSAAEVRFVQTLVAEHLRPVQLAQVGEVPTLRAIYRFARDAGDALPAVLLLALADAAAARGPSLTRDGWARHVAYMNSLLVRTFGEAATMHPPRLLSGHDIMSRFGVPEGPRVGRLLEAVREAQAAGEVQDVAGAEAYVRRLLAEEGAAIADQAEARPS
jgi:poly(A) polymerase